MKTRRAAIVLGLSILATACARYGDAQVAVYGPYPSLSDEQLVQQAARALAAHGYQVTEVDVSAGRVSAPARYHGRGGASATFVVQCFAGGWMQMRVEGIAVRSHHGRYATVPNALRDEYVALAASFIEPPSEGDR